RVEQRVSRVGRPLLTRPSGARRGEAEPPAAGRVDDRVAGRDRGREGLRLGGATGPADEVLTLANDTSRTGDRDRAAPLPRREPEHALDMGGGRALRPRALEPGTHDPARQRGRLFRDGRTQAIAVRDRRAAGGSRGGEEVLLVAQARGERRQRRGQARVELRGKERQHEPADAVPGPRQIRVGAVHPERQSSLGEEPAHVGARDAEERPEKRTAYRTDAAET